MHDTNKGTLPDHRIPKEENPTQHGAVAVLTQAAISTAGGNRTGPGDSSGKCREKNIRF